MAGCVLFVTCYLFKDSKPIAARCRARGRLLSSSRVPMPDPKSGPVPERRAREGVDATVATRFHRDVVHEKAADATRPEPVPLTEELCLEAVGEDPRAVRVIELLFTSLEPLPALRSCENLQELTLMHARMARMPPELQHVRSTLKRLSLAGNEIETIEHLDGMVRLHSLFLHDNRITSCAGLRGCVALQRLWLSANRIESLDHLGHLRALRELWAQANPIASPAGLEGLSSLQVLSLAGTKIGSLAQLELLRPVTTRVDRPGRRLS